jgi:WD40-like Beta Propeller Repeat
VNERKLHQALVATAPPDEIGAQRRTWRVARTAFADREPLAWPVRHRRSLVLAVVAVAILAAALSSPGRAMIDRVRDAVGTEKVVGVPVARPNLFSLPAPGRVLVAAPTGAWVVSADGHKRRLGDYTEATWSPEGRFVGVSKRSQLAAVTPTGTPRWTLARPAVRSPRWAPSGFRVAYLSGVNLRVVAGDGTDDKKITAVQKVAPAWRPGTEEHVLAFVDRGGNINVEDTDAGQVLWTAGESAASPKELEWSLDASRLLAVRRVQPGRMALVVFDGDGRRRQYLELDGEPVAAAFSPANHDVALIRRVGPRSELLVVNADSLREQRVVFSGLGRFSDVTWSPDGRWMLLGWAGADQWLFIRSADVSKIKAVSSLAVQFDPGGAGKGPFPRIEGWCCPG